MREEGRCHLAYWVLASEEATKKVMDSILFSSAVNLMHGGVGIAIQKKTECLGQPMYSIDH